MTWTRLVKSTVGVSAWRLGHPDPAEDRVQLGLGSAYAHLDVDEAESLAGYLLGTAQGIREERERAERAADEAAVADLDGGAL